MREIRVVFIRGSCVDFRLLFRVGFLVWRKWSFLRVVVWGECVILERRIRFRIV